MKKILFLAVVLMMFTTLNSYSLIVKEMNWGALTGCGIYSTRDGELTDIRYDENVWMAVWANCKPNPSATCFTINQNCDTGKWEIWYLVTGTPSPDDIIYHIYWDPVLQKPVIDEVNNFKENDKSKLQ